MADVSRILAVLVAGLLAASPVRAEFWSGNALYAELTSTDSSRKLLGLGYVMGVHDAHETVNHCSPGTVTAGQVRDVVLRFLESAPEYRHRTADVIIREVLKATWPCAARPSQNGGSRL